MGGRVNKQYVLGGFFGASTYPSGMWVYSSLETSIDLELGVNPHALNLKDKVTIGPLILGDLGQDQNHRPSAIMY